MSTDAPEDQPTLDLPPSGRSSALTARFNLLGEAGRGGMGIVYKARDRETSEMVALKVLKPELAADQATLERFKTELRLAHLITHKNVCRIHDFHRMTDGTACISMEFVEGESLRRILSRLGPLSLRTALRLTHQICEGLREAHTQGVIHRDLKPENLMLDLAGNVKIMDFGIARSVETGTGTTGMIVGTPAYMAPEQAQGKAVDRRADIYALGLILYEMLTGSTAFTGETPVTVALKQINEAPAPPRNLEPTVPEYVERATLKCLEKSPANRFQSAEELDAALARRAEPAAAPKETEEVVLPMHVARWRRADSILFVAAALAGIVFFLLFGRFHPAAASGDILDPPALERAARSTLEKLGLKVESVKMDKWPFPDTDDYGKLALTIGIPAAQEYYLTHQKTLLGREFNFKASSPSGERRTGWVALNASGGATAIYVGSHLVSGPQALPPPDPAAMAQMKEVARKAIADVFGRDFSSAEPSQAAFIRTQGATFKWLVPMRRKGVYEAFAATVLGPDTFRLSRRIEAQASIFSGMFSGGWWAIENAVRRFFVAFAVMLFAALVLFVVRRVYRQPAVSADLWLAIIAGTLGAVSASAIPHSGQGGTTLSLVVPAITFCVVTLAAFIVLRAVLYYVRGRFPEQAGSYLLLSREGFMAQPAGLDFLRGCFAGVIFSGAWMAFVSLLGVWGMALPGMLEWLFVVAFEREAGSAGSFPALLVAEVLVGTWLLVALPLSFLIKTTSRRWVMLVALAGVWIAFGYTLIGPMAIPLVPYYAVSAGEAIFFGWVFLRYGLVATASAILTAEALLLSYPLWRIFGWADTWTLATPFLSWALLLLIAALMAWRPQLVAAVRRTAAVFE